MVKLNTDVVFNLADNSRYIAPSISYAIQTNLYLSFGLQWFSGEPGSEYARPPSVAHMTL